MSVAHHEPGTDAARLRQRGLRVTGPRLAILAMLEQVGGHRSADELVLALRRAGYHHARTTVYNALDDLARAKLLRAAPVDAGALRYESAGDRHHHFVCRACGLIRNVPVAEDLETRPLPDIEGADLDEIDVVYRGVCASCAAMADEAGMGLMAHDADGHDDDPQRARTPGSHGPGHGEPHSISGVSTSTMGGGELVELHAH